MTRRLRGMAFFLMLILLALNVSSAFAGTSIEGSVPNKAPADNSDIVDRLLSVLDFKFFNKDNGIGYGYCPVYTAPSESAYRMANGKAGCDTNSYMSVGGYDSTGWLMIRYQANTGNTRVGYIPPQYVRGYKADVSNLKFDYIPVQAAETLYVTDDPMLDLSAFAMLDQGEEFYILGKYTYFGNWWYIECTVDNQLARGFIRRDVSGFIADGKEYHSNKDLGNPLRSPLNTQEEGQVTVKGTEARIIRREPDVNTDMVARVYGGDVFPCYAAKKGANGNIWYYIWIDGVWGWISSGMVMYEEN